MQTLFVNRKSPDAKVRSAANRASVAKAIRDDIRTGGESRIIAIDFLKNFSSTMGGVWVAEALDGHWIDDLKRIKEDELIVQLIDQTDPEVLAKSQFNLFVRLQRYRFDALNSLGRYDEMLSTARVYYNICPFANTQAAIDLVAKALGKTRAANDPEIINRFRAEQVAAPSESSAGQKEAVLKSIPIDGKRWEAVISSQESQPVSHGTLVRRGNALLAVDRPAEAKACFEKALGMAKSDGATTDAIEGIARSIRDIDGAVGGANAYVLSLQAKE